jgi:soluble lytic murein transglycosylase
LFPAPFFHSAQISLLALQHFHMLAPHTSRITQNAGGLVMQIILGVAVMVLLLLQTAVADVAAPAASNLQQQEQFTRAWQAASRGQRDVFEQLMPGLQDYILYPYLQYEDLRHHRASVEAAEMAVFLDEHGDWPFTAGLRKAWLRTLGKKARWDSVLSHATGSSDTEVRCYLAQARITRGQTDGLLPVAQGLWTVGESQPDPCDPVFKWLKKQGGITSGLAWERIRLAMEARQPRLTLYLIRYVDADDRIWVERWQQQDRAGYRRLDQAGKWGDQEKGRVITAYGLRRLARNDPDRAWKIFESLDANFSWSPDVRGGILREIALWSAVEGVTDTGSRMRAVPSEYRDGKLLEWWVRFGLMQQSWEDIILTVAHMPPELSDDARWRYWEAQARMQVGDTDQGRKLLGELALEASYYGFLAADKLGQPYTICPQKPEIEQPEVERLRGQGGFERALELRAAGIRNWSRSEWQMAARQLDREGLRIAAALATQENWPDMAIFALGNSGDLRWYEWRFPMEYGAVVEGYARNRKLDPSWVMGLMRSESAMAEDALSSAGARGLMQVMPDTARQLAKRHNIVYSGREQLMQAEDNIEFGTAYLRDLLDRYADNPVLAAGAYNAGPHAVDRWLQSPRAEDPAIWVETLPYFETRDYIPRVLAFTTIYDWRLQQPVTRISSRMPPFDSGSMGSTPQQLETTEVVCRASG